MGTRDIYSGSSVGPITGPAFLDQYAMHMNAMYRSVAFPLTAVSGANVVTAALDPPLSGTGLIDGMRFGLTWAAANTGGVTLSINGAAAVPVLAANGAALIAGDVGAGLRSTLEFISGAFRVLSPLLGSGSGGSASYFWQFTASGTWTKPAGLSDDRMVTVEAWGGGGGGNYGLSSSTTSCGAGGAYAQKRFRVADLPASVSVTVGAAGTGRTGSTGNGNAGGNSTFGTLLTAFGGAGGRDTAFSGGGGELAAGTNGSGGKVGGGNVAGGDALTAYGGGAGAHAGGGAGGNAVFGGGGGGFVAGGGLSAYGGNGGTAAVGQAPGGGGAGRINANGYSGARGEVRVWI